MSKTQGSIRYKVLPSVGCLDDTAIGVFGGGLALRDACRLAVGTRGRVFRQERTGKAWDDTEIAYTEIEKMRSLSGDVVEVFALRVVVSRDEMNACERGRFSRPMYR